MTHSTVMMIVFLDHVLVVTLVLLAGLSLICIGHSLWKGGRKP